MSTPKILSKPSSLPNHKSTFKNYLKFNLYDITLHDFIANYNLSNDNNGNQGELLEEKNTYITSMNKTIDGSNDQLLIEAVKTNNPPNLENPQILLADIRNIIFNPSPGKRAVNASEEL